jgi:hypothetical protein
MKAGCDSPDQQFGAEVLALQQHCRSPKGCGERAKPHDADIVVATREHHRAREEERGVSEIRDG